jgi:dolichol-phosphate mannosyltransferase
MLNRVAFSPTSQARSGIALSIVVPCYNEAASLREFHRRMEGACRQSVAGEYEIILVDDGSTDETWLTANNIATQSTNVLCIKLARNHGHQLAVTAGLHLSRGERVLVIDADLQDPPELLSQMISSMESLAADVVYGQRTERQGETAFKKISAAAFYRILNYLVDRPIPKDTGDFRLMSRRTVDLLLAMPERHRFIRGMVSWIGFKQIPMPYTRDKRFAGTTNYTIARMIKLAADAIVSFSVWPLRLASMAAALLGVLSVGVIIYTIYSWICLNAVPGWASTVILVGVLGTFQLLTIGFIGEYVGRIYLEVKQRPLFVVDEIVSARTVCTAELRSGAAPGVPSAVYSQLRVNP